MGREAESMTTKLVPRLKSLSTMPASPLQRRPWRGRLGRTLLLLFPGTTNSICAAFKVEVGNAVYCALLLNHRKYDPCFLSRLSTPLVIGAVLVRLPLVMLIWRQGGGDGLYFWNQNASFADLRHDHRCDLLLISVACRVWCSGADVCLVPDCQPPRQLRGSKSALQVALPQYIGYA